MTNAEEIEFWDAEAGPRWAEFQEQIDCAFAQEFGDRWIREARSLALQVQSVIGPDEKNVVINPLHPRFADAKTSPPIDYPLDSRLLGRSTPAK